MNKCDKCGGLHWRTAPCIPAKKSTAPRTDEGFESPIVKRRTGAATVANVQSGSELDGSNLSASPAQGERPTPQARSSVALNKGAGTQALPVDTNSQAVESGVSTFGPHGVITSSAGTEGEVDRPKFDKVAYQARYMREIYRPRLKARNAKP